MGSSGSARTTLLWHAGLALLGILIACVAFAAFVPGPERGNTFYIAACIVCTAILVLFAHLAHTRLARAGYPTASAPTRIMVQFLIFIWFVLAVITAIVVSHPERADTLFADRVFVIYLILTFVFFGAAYYLYTKDIEVEQENRELAAARRKIHVHVPDVEDVLRAVKEVGNTHEAHAVLADRVEKKVDTVRTALEAAFVSDHALERPGGHGFDWNAEVERQHAEIESEVARLKELASAATAASNEEAADRLTQIGNQADGMLSMLKRHGQAMM